MFCAGPCPLKDAPRCSAQAIFSFKCGITGFHHDAFTRRPFPGDTGFMRTQKAYNDYAGAEKQSARILELRRQGERAAVILDKTIFYPEGGGQSADRGTINGVPLLDVREEDGEILHFVDIHAGLESGPAELILDAERRRDLTVQHSGQHLLSGTLLRLFSSPTLSMHMGELYNTIDVERENFTPQELLAAEEAVARAIEADSPIVVHLCPPEDVKSFPLRKIPPDDEEVIRVVEITGHDFSPCCGTHCASTGAIGMLRVLGTERYKGMSRVSFIAGRRVLRDSRALRQEAELISRALNVPVTETSPGTLALLERYKDLEKKFAAAQEEAARAEAQALVKEAGASELIRRTYADLDMEAVLRIGKAAQKITQAVLLLASEKDRKFTALCSRKGIDLKALVEKRFKEHGGQGGGGGFFQGRFPSPEALRSFLADMELTSGS
jgi:alanyl-tRNA synthetase